MTCYDIVARGGERSWQRPRRPAYGISGAIPPAMAMSWWVPLGGFAPSGPRCAGSWEKNTDITWPQRPGRSLHIQPAKPNLPDHYLPEKPPHPETTNVDTRGKKLPDLRLHPPRNEQASSLRTRSSADCVAHVEVVRSNTWHRQSASSPLARAPRPASAPRGRRPWCGQGTMPWRPRRGCGR